ncbi:hypothetical protein L2725_17875 [Shewanella corallii]|uniref:Integrase n=2 Tax=Shewanella TaxID=22 RepID=A0ABT0NAX5_9GAMM|nr:MULTISPECIES: hypothetical protein [Shewanella]MCL1039752.1 hypothetical protein [Shewanella submarina]MCL2915624.1 hypothetical protein [Shewanella corallii]
MQRLKFDEDLRDIELARQIAEVRKIKAETADNIVSLLILVALYGAAITWLGNWMLG